MPRLFSVQRESVGPGAFWKTPQGCFHLLPPTGRSEGFHKGAFLVGGGPTTVGFSKHGRRANQTLHVDPHSSRPFLKNRSNAFASATLLAAVWASELIVKIREYILKLYRFESSSESRIKTLKENKLWMSLPDSFNDPFDCDLNLRSTSSTDEGEDECIKNAVSALYQNHKFDESYWFFDEEILTGIQSWANETDKSIGRPSFVDKIESRTRSFGLQCFSEDLDNPLMWGYYASGHRGFCIEYECSHNTVAMKGHGKVSLDQIVYVSVLPEFSVSEVILSPHEFQKRLYSTKSYHWMHEKEHRLIYFDMDIEPGAKGGKINLPHGIEVTGIYAGFLSDRVGELKDAAQTINVPLFQMCKLPGSYQMSSKEIQF